MSYDSYFRILRSKLYALVVAFAALSAPAVYAQENGSPGAGGPNFAIYPRLLNSSNAWNFIQRDPPCLPPSTSGTITLTLDHCSNPSQPRNGGSPAFWKLNLSGNSTLAVTGLAVGQVFRIDIVANGFTLAFPSGFVLPPSNPVVSGNSFIACETHDSNTIWCPGGVQPGLVAAPTSAVLSHAGSTVINANSNTLSIDLTTGSTLIVGYGQTGGASGVGSIAGTGVGTCTQFTNAGGGNGALFYCPVTSTGTGVTITLTQSGTDTFWFGALDVSGLTATPDDAGVGAYATGNSTTLTVPGAGTTTETNELVVAVGYILSNSTFTAGVGYTISNQATNGSNASGALEYQFQSTTGTPTATMTATAAAGYAMAIGAAKH